MEGEAVFVVPTSNASALNEEELGRIRFYSRIYCQVRAVFLTRAQ